MRIAIIGGGAAGMLAAIATKKFNTIYHEKGNEPSQVFILEKNEKLGKKLFISGKGRCNLTNACGRDEFFKNIVRNSKFLYSAFSEFSNEDLQNLVEDNGCELKVERGNRVFPVSDKSYDVIDALKRAVRDAGVIVKLNTEVLNIKFKECFEIDIKGKGKMQVDKVIVATGGLSYPSTGSTGDGYKFAKDFGINVIEQSPSLVPFNVKEIEECKEMQGLALKNVAIKVYDDNLDKVLYKDFGELLFTHFGVSGPTILSASCYIEGNNNILSIDLKPALSDEQLDQRLLREFEENNNKMLKSVIGALLPNAMVLVFINRLSKILNISDGSSIKTSNVSKEMRKCIVSLLKDFRFMLISKRGYDEAIITRGGIDIKEINPKNMESKKVKGLYFAGEVLDIDAMTGGFNIQIASSTGYAAGKGVFE